MRGGGGYRAIPEASIPGRRWPVRLWAPACALAAAAGLLSVAVPRALWSRRVSPTPPPVASPHALPPSPTAGGLVPAAVGRLSTALRDDLSGLLKMVLGDKGSLIPRERALPDRPTALQVVNEHYVLKTPIQPPFPAGLETVVFGTGCFWGTEKMFWKLPGVYSTAVGYANGYTKNPTYEDVCSGKTGHNEVVLVVYDPTKVSFVDLLRNFWESHDPTQGMRQGNDRGTQYRSGIYPTTEAQAALAAASLGAYQAALAAKGYPAVTTELVPDAPFFYAENYHQQYLAKPMSRPYCSAQPTGIPVPPFAEWAPAGFDAHTPKLPDAYWAQYGPKPGCTIAGPNAQNRWPAAP